MSTGDEDWILSRQGRDLQSAVLVWRDWTPPPAADVRAWRIQNGTVIETAAQTAARPDGAVEPVQPRGWDHDHCDLCWRTFMSAETTKDDPEILTAGYTIAGPERTTTWICPNCFNDLHERFHWTVVSDEDGPE